MLRRAGKMTHERTLNQLAEIANAVKPGLLCSITLLSMPVGIRRTWERGRSRGGGNQAGLKGKAVQGARPGHFLKWHFSVELFVGMSGLGDGRQNYSKHNELGLIATKKPCDRDARRQPSR